MNIKVWGESMAYIENIVIGTPIVDPKDNKDKNKENKQYGRNDKNDA